MLRYTFTIQFVEAAAIFVRKAAAIEADYTGMLSEEQRTEHRALVSTAIMQCAAALETEASEICIYGPGAYLGSNGINLEAKQVLEPLADFIDDQATLNRYQVLLRILKKPVLQTGHEPYQSAALLIRLRNEITHYKSRWGEEMSSSRFFRSLEALRHRPPPFTKVDQNFFPHRCLSADCGAWAVRTTVAFLDKVYHLLGVSSRFESHRARIDVPR